MTLWTLTWDCGYSLEEDRPIEDLILGYFTAVPPCGLIKKDSN